MNSSVLRKIASGDAAAVRDCIDQYGGLIWSLARRLSRTPADAEDATQEIFLQIWCQASRFDEALGSEKTFIAMIARRRLIDRLRKASAEPLMESAVDALDSAIWIEPGNTLETCDEAEHAMRALCELRPEQRQVIELGCLHGLTHAEISDRLRLPLGTVKSFMRRGLLSIRECLNRDTRSPHTEEHPSLSVMVRALPANNKEATAGRQRQDVLSAGIGHGSMLIDGALEQGVTVVTFIEQTLISTPCPA